MNSPTPETPTPRTDAFEIVDGVRYVLQPRAGFPDITAFARQLERENTALRSALDGLVGGAAEAITVLDFAFNQGALDSDLVTGLYPDPWGMLRDLKSVQETAKDTLAKSSL